MPAMDRFDVCVKGSGAVGMSLALALARQGLRVAISAAPAAATGSGPAPDPAHTDVRAFALNAASRRLLTEMKVWSALPADAVTAVYEMQVAGDSAADKPTAQAVASVGAIEFSAWQQRVEALAWIVDAAELESALDSAVRCAPQLQRVDHAVDAELCLWADGKASAAHAAPGMRVERHDYGQTAVAARLACDQPHNHTAWQWFRSPDVLALLPFDRPAAGHGFALVWSLPAAQAQAMRQMAEADFEALLNAATAGRVGRLRLAGRRGAWPLSLARAQPLCGPGWAALGDAAHVVHPLAGQGLNLGLADVASLAGVIAAREPWRGLGDERLLHRYVRARALPTQAMAGLTDGLLRLFANPRPLVRGLRNHGMDLLNHLAPIKRALTARALDA